MPAEAMYSPYNILSMNLERCDQEDSLVYQLHVLYHERFQVPDLLHEGLIVCSACIGGEIPQLILSGQLNKAEESVLWFKNLFGDDYYLEIQRHETHVAGLVYSYDIKKNLDLIFTFYPKTKHIVLITDNSYGGIALQALVKKEISYKPVDLIELDGRKYDIYQINDSLKELPSQTAILIGSWRVDKNDSYYIGTATHSMKAIRPDIPAFTPTSVGLGYWVIGGYMPKYHPVGKELAREVINILSEGNNKNLHGIDQQMARQLSIASKLWYNW